MEREAANMVLNINEEDREDDHDLMDLPPGFRFHPTDEEIISYYLTEKVMNSGFSAKAIGEVDMNKCEPWDLPKRAKMGSEKEWFFFCQRDRKYPTGMRTNRATESGYWKATGKDKEIYNSNNNKSGKGVGGGGNCVVVGMKKTLVFYKGRAPKGEKSNWVMHEYRLEGRFSYYNFPKGAAKDEWVVCRVFHKNNNNNNILRRVDSFLDHILDSPNSLPPLMDLPRIRSSSTAADRPAAAAAASTTSYTHDDEDELFKPSISASASSSQSVLLQEDQKNFTIPPINYYATPTPTPTPTPAAFMINNSTYQPSSSCQNPLLIIPNSIFCPQNSQDPNLYETQDRNLGSILNYLGGSEFKPPAVDQEIFRQYCKMEQFSSNNNSNMVMSQSQETASRISNNDVNYLQNSSMMIKKRSSTSDNIIIGNNMISSSSSSFDHEDLEAGLAVAPNDISDLDSLWDY